MNPLIAHSDDFPPDAPLGTVLGGKAAALAHLGSAGLPIPPWFVVPPSVYTACAAADGVTRDLSPEMAQVIVDTARRVAPTANFFAVRSSAVDEDGADHSFAGQLESYLFVPPERIPEKVEAVWRSGFTERILAYRRERGLSGPPQPPAVLVQQMIDATSAGVAFSADPVNGRRGHAIVSAVWGLGSALVSGEADADTFTVDRARRIVARSVATKRSAHRAELGGAAGEGVRTEALAPALADTPALDDAQAVAVAELARATARHFGRPQDIEWAIADGALWLLQSRPITSLAALPDPDGELNLWDNANIAESYSGVTTPLTFSFARGIYEAVYREFARLMGVSTARIAEERDLFPRMLGLIQGRIYYNLVSWYRLLALLPGYAFNRGFMEQMMGVKEGLPEEIALRIAPPTDRWSRLRDAVALGRSCAGLLRNHLTLPRQIRAFYVRLEHALRGPTPPLEERRPDELVAHYRDLERQLLLRWDAPLVNDFFAMIFYGVLRKLTAKWCGDSDGTLQNDLLCAEGGMISAEPAKRVRELAALAANDPAAVELLCTGSWRAISRWLPTSPAFHDAYTAYLAKFGDRCLEELKLESRTLHDEPLTLLRSVGQFARRFGVAGLADAGVEVKLRAAAEARVTQALRGRPLRRMIFGWVLRHTRARVRDRENLRFERTRLFGRVRRIVLELGKQFHAAGRLNDPRDVFYLTVEEALGFVDGTTVTRDLSSLVALRQREFAAYREPAAQPADRFGTRGAVHLGNRFQSDRAAAPISTEGDTLKGIGCCPGIVRGRARVILDPRTAEIIAGEILVAPRTDPGWIMLFPSAAGLLVEHGSLLSHSAIVAREMGIPAIVSIGGVTTWLKTGDWVELDGSTGLARKLPAAPEESPPLTATA
ncbi:MAG TPA: PEP/pyruvate-binding domain-containing protein [Candidatus Synoicihabitans sp.]|nr:PEP/pyruvate-binding domain-containing protein [Candidatus Synoicihabitans sp.]